MRVQVELWGDHPSAIEATRDTIRQLQTGASAVLFEEDGRWFLEATEFVIWACERQGYVKRVIRPAGVRPVFG